MTGRSITKLAEADDFTGPATSGQPIVWDAASSRFRSQTTLLDDAGHPFIDVDSGSVFDLNGVLSSLLRDRVLFSTGGPGGGGALSADWENRRLYDSSNNVVVTWNNGFTAYGLSVSPKGSLLTTSNRNVFYVVDYGVKCNGIQLQDVSTQAGQFNVSSLTARFTPDDVDKKIAILGAGAAGSTLVSTITAYVDDNTVTLQNSAAATLVGLLACYGTDDTDGWQSCLNAAIAAARDGYIKSSVIIAPMGVSIIAGALQAIASNCILHINNIIKQDDGVPTVTLHIRTEGWSSAQYWGYPNDPPHLTGCILFFLAKVASGTHPSLLGSMPDRADFQPGTVGLRLDNINFRQLAPAQFDAVNWHMCGDFQHGNLLVDTFCRIANQIEPISGTGVRYPAMNSNAINIGDVVQVFGHFRGIEIANQTHIRHAFINYCKKAICPHSFTGNEAGKIDYCLLQVCQEVLSPIYADTAIAGFGQQNYNLTIPLMQIEKSQFSNPADPLHWTYTTGNDINDPGDALTGTIGVVQNFDGLLPSRNSAKRLRLLNMMSMEEEGGGRLPWVLRNVSGPSASWKLEDISGSRITSIVLGWGGINAISLGIEDRYGGPSPVINLYNGLLATYDLTFQMSTRDWRFRVVDYTSGASWAPWMDDDSFNGWCSGAYVKNGKLVFKLRLAGTLYYATMTLSTTAP